MQPQSSTIWIRCCFNRFLTTLFHRFPSQILSLLIHDHCCYRLHPLSVAKEHSSPWILFSICHFTLHTFTRHTSTFVYATHFLPFFPLSTLSDFSLTFTHFSRTERGLLCLWLCFFSPHPLTHSHKFTVHFTNTHVGLLTMKAFGVNDSPKYTEWTPSGASGANAFPRRILWLKACRYLWRTAAFVWSLWPFISFIVGQRAFNRWCIRVQIINMVVQRHTFLFLAFHHFLEPFFLLYSIYTIVYDHGLEMLFRILDRIWGTENGLEGDWPFGSGKGNISAEFPDSEEKVIFYDPRNNVLLAG